MRALLLLLAFSAHAGMALNPAVTQDNIRSTICVKGWTATVRPPRLVTERIKHALMRQAGLPRSRAREFELDHRVALTLGGAPRSPDNLWLQSWGPWAFGWNGATDARVKDKLEVRLNRLVCSGALPLAEAQRCIYEDWPACFRQHLPKGPPT
jgi:hypothetical protein